MSHTYLNQITIKEYVVKYGFGIDWSKSIDWYNLVLVCSIVQNMTFSKLHCARIRSAEHLIWCLLFFVPPSGDNEDTFVSKSRNHFASLAFNLSLAQFSSAFPRTKTSSKICKRLECQIPLRRKLNKILQDLTCKISYTKLHFLNYQILCGL